MSKRILLKSEGYNVDYARVKDGNVYLYQQAASGQWNITSLTNEVLKELLALSNESITNMLNVEQWDDTHVEVTVGDGGFVIQNFDFQNKELLMSMLISGCRINTKERAEEVACKLQEMYETTMVAI